MERLFIRILNLSITSGYVIIAVLLIRLFLKKAPGYIRCLLWALVGVRLMVPFSLESIFRQMGNGIQSLCLLYLLVQL